MYSKHHQGHQSRVAEQNWSRMNFDTKKHSTVSHFAFHCLKKFWAPDNIIQYRSAGLHTGAVYTTQSWSATPLLCAWYWNCIPLRPTAKSIHLPEDRVGSMPPPPRWPMFAARHWAIGVCSGIKFQSPIIRTESLTDFNSCKSWLHWYMAICLSPLWRWRLTKTNGRDFCFCTWRACTLKAIVGSW